MAEFGGDDPGDIQGRIEAARGGFCSRTPGKSEQRRIAGTSEALWSIRHAASPMLARLGGKPPFPPGDRGRLRAVVGNSRIHRRGAPVRRATAAPGGDLRARRRGQSARESPPRPGGGGLAGASDRDVRGSDRDGDCRVARPAGSMATGGSGPICWRECMVPRSWRCSAW